MANKKAESAQSRLMEKLNQIDINYGEITVDAADVTEKKISSGKYISIYKQARMTLVRAKLISHLSNPVPV